LRSPYRADAYFVHRADNTRYLLGYDVGLRHCGNETTSRNAAQVSDKTVEK
jgi:hypothetical protein